MLTDPGVSDSKATFEEALDYLAEREKGCRVRKCTVRGPTCSLQASRGGREARRFASLACSAGARLGKGKFEAAQ